MTRLDEVFGKINENGNVDILYKNSGESVTRLETEKSIYPCNSSLSIRYEHINGIQLTVEQCNSLNIEIE